MNESLVTPDPPGERAKWGALFALHDEPDEEWLAWQPVMAVEWRAGLA